MTPAPWRTSSRRAILKFENAQCFSLSESYDIAVRPGAHCAPLMHKALGTTDQGAVRFSFSWFNTEEEIDTAVRAIREIAEDPE